MTAEIGTVDAPRRLVFDPAPEERAKAFVARHQWLITRENCTCFEPDRPSTWRASDFAKFVSEHRWTFAWTMLKNPHEYTLRRRASGVVFDEAVRFTRQHGSIEFFKGKPYKMLVVGDHKYWTMGSPLGTTALINRKGFLPTTGRADSSEHRPIELPLLAPQEEHLPRNSCNQDLRDFEWFAAFVCNNGVRQPRSRTSRLDFDNYRYWVVGVPEKTPKLQRGRLRPLVSGSR